MKLFCASISARKGDRYVMQSLVVTAENMKDAEKIALQCAVDQWPNWYNHAVSCLQITKKILRDFERGKYA